MAQPLHVERRPQLLILGAAVAVAATLGWWLFFFLTDDAFIAFRYISNSVLGRGLVWNPSPFRPVEGYTSWLWVVLLREVWALTGVEPPTASNFLSLVFGYATLFTGYKLVERMELPPSLSRHRLAFLALVFLGTVTNRTFLAWLSSGLETALFNFCFTLWIYHALAPRARRGRSWMFWISLAATLSALTRPDGLLAVVATPVLIGLDGVERREPAGGWLRRLLWAFPLAGTPIHVLWRRATYGEWLPNTYFAKQVAPWPESGARYAASFALEYAVWVWLALAIVWLVRDRKMSWQALTVAGVVAAHFGYYTFMVGGDHFEYRVYSHLVLLLFVSFLWLAARLELRPATAGCLFAVFIVSSWPIPWVHHLETRAVQTRDEAVKLFRPVAPRFPPLLRSYAQAFDALQEWLIDHFVCLRHQEHKVFYEFQTRRFPSRERGAEISWRDRPVADLYSVGYASWVLPHVAIIDQLGLNDYVVARNDEMDLERRTMAHDRRPPRGYVRCFRPNVYFEGNVLRFEPREKALTDAEIVRCEDSFLERVRAERGRG